MNIKNVAIRLITATITIFFVFEIYAQDTSDGTPVPVELVSVFPTNLYCEDIDTYELGLTWETVQIGRSTFDDLLEQVEMFSDDYDLEMNESSNESFAIYNIVDGSDGLGPAVIWGCIRDEIIMVMQLGFSLSPNKHNLYLSDLAEVYGLPDTVTYSSGFSHLVFWFEEGVAAEVLTPTDDLTHEPKRDNVYYGIVTLITYFPPQSNENYEDRWPYSRTFKQNPYRPDPVGTENPYDFEAMLATITAQPSPTITATFTPYPTSTPTATP